MFFHFNDFQVPARGRPTRSLEDNPSLLATVSASATAYSAKPPAGPQGVSVQQVSQRPRSTQTYLTYSDGDMLKCNFERITMLSDLAKTLGWFENLNLTVKFIFNAFLFNISSRKPCSKAWTTRCFDTSFDFFQKNGEIPSAINKLPPPHLISNCQTGDAFTEFRHSSRDVKARDVGKGHLEAKLVGEIHGNPVFGHQDGKTLGHVTGAMP